MPLPSYTRSFFPKHSLHIAVGRIFFSLASLLLSGILLLFPCACSGSHTLSNINSETELSQNHMLSSKESMTSAEASFSALLDELFKEYAASDSLSLHYTVADPESLELQVPNVSLGHFGETAIREANQTAGECLTQLHSISKDLLNDSDRLTYDLLEYALENSLVPEQAILYNSPLGPTTGIQTQLPILLAEYRFSSVEDVENYFLLLEDLPNYFSELCAFEKARAAAGTVACEEVLSRILLQCRSFTEDPGNNFLIESFRDRLAVLPELTASQTAELCIRNQTLVFTKVIPAYEQLIDTLRELSDTSVPAKGLASYPGGAAYYEHLVRSSTGSHKSMEETEQMLQKALTENMLTMMTLYESEALQKELTEYQNNGLSMTASVPEHASSVLLQLQEQIQIDFPAPAEAFFRVQTIHPSLEDYISPALYLVPPFDNYKENVIYINREKCSPENFFSTLAHEGYPGHLYQNTYFASTSPHPVRMLLNFTGYDEGWGTYAELFSYQYADCSEELRQFLIAEQIAGLCLYSLSDIRIHYHGEDLSSVSAFLQKYGFSAETAEEIFYTQLAEPAVYLPYSVGYLEICNLRDLYCSLKGTDASLLPFHTFLLETGPAPFSILEQRLTEQFR